MDFLDVLRYLLAAVFAGLVARQLGKGEMHGHDRKPTATRQEEFGKYWLILLFQAGCAILFLVARDFSDPWIKAP